MRKKRSAKSAVNLPAGIVLKEHNQLFRNHLGWHKAFPSLIQKMSGEERAEAYLKWVADRYDTLKLGEAAVYLFSRGQGNDAISSCIRNTWQREENESMTYIEDRQLVRNTNILSPFVINFWNYFETDDMSRDATMLRLVEWCEIGGFERWWHRFAEDLRRAVLRGDFMNGFEGILLFALCRCDSALESMSATLSRLLEVSQLSRGFAEPFWYYPAPDDFPNKVQYFQHAANVLFAGHRLCKSGIDHETRDEALSMLIREQKSSGAWEAYTGNGEDVESTAAVVHALALWKPTGWRLAATRAAEWLWLQQAESGEWRTTHSARDVYLTVLVLDAIDLANGETRLTFGLAKDSLHQPANADIPIWDRVQSELRFNGKVIRKVHRRAANLIRVLDAFQEQGWASRIDDPLPGGRDSQRLRETVRTLTDGEMPITFNSDGTGAGIEWKRVDSE